MTLEAVAPIIGAILAAITAIVAAVFAYRGGRLNQRDSRAPDVTEAWTAAEKARDRMFTWQDLFFAVRGAFKGYARRMADTHGDAAALTDAERHALELEPPTEPKETP